eukprot:gnl/TRDRNA2_/TRDRNA2_165031_c0_seq2.p2 gnl/TRDRNA2_/TRDRNA2_165031_c0~~gnl/TRDRNA2_/TRDRNA2_165031_c0_seq2.p2  ORF type:complete len:204 (+),score=22.10 gnl/TRDRNA2_/TRDRNA2_165031_c0_seq2:349-960(+)
MAVYGWKPGVLQAWFAPCRIVSFVSITFLGPAVATLPSIPVLVAVQVLGALLALAQVFAPFWSGILVYPRIIGSAFAMATSISAAFLSGQFPAEQQAKVQAVGHLVTNVATSLSMILFSSTWIFRPEARAWAATRPFAISAALVLLSSIAKTAMLVRGVQNLPQHRECSNGQELAELPALEDSAGAASSGRRGVPKGSKPFEV